MSEHMKVTARMLLSKRACEVQVMLFKKAFPYGTTINLKSAMKALRSSLDIGWFADEFLHGKRKDAYNRAVSTAERKYDKIRVKGFSIMRKNTTSYRYFSTKWHRENTRFQKVIRQAVHTYNDAVAHAFVKAFQEEEKVLNKAKAKK